MNIAQAKHIPMTSILASVGCEPVRLRGRRVYYKSPFRIEKKASFIVDTSTNKWHDFGNGSGSDTLDFVRCYANIDDVSGALAWLEKNVANAYMPMFIGSPVEDIIEEKLDYKTQPLTYHVLLEYLASRGIPADVAQRYCKEIWYKYNGNNYFGVAFPARSGSYEVRNPYNKRCIGHKEITFVRVYQGRRTNGCCVFEGFMDFLSYVVLFRQKHALSQTELCDCIVLNSVANLHKALPEMRNYYKIHCYLDNDQGGQTATERIHEEFFDATVDESIRYGFVNDLNDYLMHIRGLRKTEDKLETK